MSASILLSPALISALSAPPAQAEATSTPALDSAHEPALGMQVRSVAVTTGTEQYALTARAWGDVVAENPSLLRDQRRAELFAPGVAGLGLGSLWLLISGAATIDEFRYAQDQRNRGLGDNLSRDDQTLSAGEITFRFVLPSAILITGAVLTTTGVRARRRYERARDAFYLGPQFSRGGGGVSVGGRF